ncbi:winged helix-turn-helix transcriptional regulator [Natrialbaceae archaeon A-gly3]
MSDVRQNIRRQVSTDPGIHFNELVRELDLAAGQTQYHVRRLLRTEEIVSEELYGRTHYYPDGYDDWDRRALALFRRETCRDVLLYLIEYDSVRPDAVADSLDIARSTLEYHLSHLTEEGLVEKRYDDRNRVTLHLANPERTGELLSRVTPSVGDRLIDRFTRLVDTLLEDPESDPRPEN